MLGDLFAYICRAREIQGRSMESELVWSTLRKITSEELGVDESELTPQIRFVEDLNC
jgi:hypothetical protein